jgi:hypothetical protein
LRQNGQPVEDKITTSLLDRVEASSEAMVGGGSIGSVLAIRKRAGLLFKGARGEGRSGQKRDAHARQRQRIHFCLAFFHKLKKKGLTPAPLRSLRARRARGGDRERSSPHHSPRLARVRIVRRRGRRDSCRAPRRHNRVGTSHGSVAVQVPIERKRKVSYSSCGALHRDGG